MFQKFKEFSAVKKSISRFNKMPRRERRIVFFAETKNDWAYFEGLISDLAFNHEMKIAYLTSDADDPILSSEFKNVTPFYIGAGLGRTSLFRTIDCDIMLMTLPDLEQFHLKRSVNPVHYVYLFHSIVSSHMIYRERAFFSYDTIFTVGPHHDREIRQTDAFYNLKPRNILPFGYFRLEKLISEADQATCENEKEFSILIAPSWGPNSITNVCIFEILEEVLKLPVKVVYRPHPMSVKNDGDIIKNVYAKFSNNPSFELDLDIRSTKTLMNSQILISDWSGSAFEFSFGLVRPVIFVNTSPKVNNPTYKNINIVPIEIDLRGKLGLEINLNEIGNIGNIIDMIIQNRQDYLDKIGELRKDYIYNLGNSSSQGTEYILNYLKSSQN